MGFMKFQEYIDLNKKMRDKPSVDQVADYPGKPTNRPEKEKKHKDAGGKGQVGEIPPYLATKQGVDPNKGHLENGLATLGDKNLIYKAEDGWYGGKNGVSKSEQGIPGGKKAKDWVATKSEAWVNKTKSLSLLEFINKIKKEKFTPESMNTPSYQAIQETTILCKTNKKHISDLLREMKRNNVLKSLIEEAFNQPEVLQLIVEHVTENKKATKRFFSCLNEAVSAPIGMDSDEDMSDEDMEDEDMEDEDMGDEDMGDEDMGDEDMGDEDMGDEDMGDEDMGDEDMGDEDMEDEDMEDEDMEDEDMGDEDMGDEDMSDEDMEDEDMEDEDMSDEDMEDEDMSDEDMDSEEEMEKRIENRNPFYVRKKHK